MTSRGKRKRQRADASGGSPADSRRHHFVPAGYIAFFAEPAERNGKIHVWDSVEKKSWISTPNRVAWERDLYRLDPGEDAHSFEEDMGRAEGKMMGLLRGLLNENPRSTLSDETVGAVVSFVALQYVRTPEVRQGFEEFIDRIGKVKMEIVTAKREIFERSIEQQMKRNPSLTRDELPTFEEAREWAGGGDFAVRMNDSWTVASIMSIQKDVYRILCEMDLKFLWVEEPTELITGTNPVVLVRAPWTPPLVGTAVGNAEAVLVPLGPRLMFIAKPSDTSEVSNGVLPPGMAAKINHAVQGQSRQVFSRAKLPWGPR